MDRSPTPMPITSSFLDQARFKMIEERFLDTARRQVGGQVNDKLQNAMGVLYNLSRNFERAVDCIQAALSVRPDDARLWNRLGATMANGDRTTDAIAAYRQALQLYPTYVRARYNLGISCMHLNTYREAADHFLSALQLQKSPETSNIWMTMRSAVLRMPDAPSDLLQAIDSRDLAGFARAFGR
uniref:TPR_REGION domain-containing protein n=1 Tax=Steinernema glaseri TaxID=37863 RepID=A0A1I7YHG4_9BILA